jgi:hypothetical protein
MNAAASAAALGDARREGRGWRCRCPLHGERGLLISYGWTDPVRTVLGRTATVLTSNEFPGTKTRRMPAVVCSLARNTAWRLRPSGAH